MRGGWIGLGLVAVLLMAAGAVGAQTRHWSDGDIQLVMANPDLQPEDDGAVHVGGDIMGQVIVRGNDSDRVAETGFSFGTGPNSPEHTPLYTGLQDFRTDDDTADGWLLPITASDTPPGDYKFAIHAYETAGDSSSEIARLWGPAVLEDNDVTKPWPWILPGETERTSNAYGVNGVTIEFAENATASMWVDGRQVELSTWTPPERDNDNVPRQTVEEEKEVLGSGYQWTGSVSTGTTLRVEATDEAGNTVTKAVLVGVGVDAPVVEILTEETSRELVTQRSGAVHYGVTTTVQNWGVQATTVNLSVDAPDPWQANVTPSRIPLEPGDSAEIHVDAEAPSDPGGGQPAFGVDATYDAAGRAVTSTFSLGGTGADGGSGQQEDVAVRPGDGANTSGGPGQDTNGSPVGLAAPLVALLAGALVAARRWDP